MAINRLIVQAKEGDQPSFQAVAHFMQFLLGLVTGVFLFLLAGPLAALFRVPEALWAFRTLALIPCLRGCMHLDVNRMERTMRFGPVVAIDFVPQVAIALCAWPLAVWLGDYRSLLFLLLARWLLAVGTSHLLAQRAYRWGWDTAHLKHVLAFGWPLLMNGFVMLTIFQGDRFIVGARYSMADLAVYSVAGSLVLLPADVLGHVLSAVSLPLFSAAQDSPKTFGDRYVLCWQLTTPIAAAFATSCMLAGQLLISLFYGKKYEGAGILFGWMAITEGLRLLRLAPTVAAMARGDTRSLLFANLSRTLGPCLAVVAAVAGADLTLIAVSGLAGEGLAFLTSIVLVAKRHSLSPRVAYRPIAVAATLTLLAGMAVAAGVPHAGWPTVLSVTLGFLLLSCIVPLLLFPHLRRHVCLAAGHLLHGRRSSPLDETGM
jgi:O-antigen/teichoic acid export membrane protein